MPRRDRIFSLLAVFAWTLLLGILFYVQYQSDDRSAQSMMLQAARGIFQQIVVTREWNAEHGGLYVPVTETTQPNPYLPETDRTVTAANGLRLARVNPAFMTRQISEVAAKGHGPSLHITSAKPLRPENGPTPWETQALSAFEQGDAERYGLDQSQDGPVFRYMAPLFVNESCLPCHLQQDYAVGQVRGGISVALAANYFLSAQSAAFGGTASLYALIWLVGATGVGLGTATILAGKHRAETANQAKSTFMAILSHELRTPLNGVLGMLELTRSTDLTEDQDSMLADAQVAAKTMYAQVQELLELAGLENGQGILQKTQFIPTEAVAAVVQTARCAAANKGLAFDFLPDPTLPRSLLGDGSRFARILGLILDNAVKFTTAGGIVVTLAPLDHKDGRFVLVATVTDTGCGIPPDRLAAVFEPFSQGEAVLTRRNPGLGVGLTIARRHAQILGARLTAQSSPDSGSIFTLCAPFNDA